MIPIRVRLYLWVASLFRDLAAETGWSWPEGVAVGLVKRTMPIMQKALRPHPEHTGTERDS